MFVMKTTVGSTARKPLVILTRVTITVRQQYPLQIWPHLQISVAISLNIRKFGTIVALMGLHALVE